jgi:muconolactone delta-isomerase
MHTKRNKQQFKEEGIKMKKHYLAFFSIALLLGFTLWGIACVDAQEPKAKEKIKFLVISEAKDILYAMPAEERVKIQETTTNSLKQGVKAGEILEFYNVPGWNRTVSIEQYESVEELYKHFEGDPIYPYTRFEVYPLLKGDIQTEGAEEAKPDKKMKFLVISEAKDILYAMPEDERMKIEEANSEFMSQLEKAGDFLEYYNIPGWNRSAAIEQYRSMQELYKHFEGYPGYPYTRFEVYPLIESDIMK